MNCYRRAAGACEDQSSQGRLCRARKNYSTFLTRIRAPIAANPYRGCAVLGSTGAACVVSKHLAHKKHRAPSLFTRYANIPRSGSRWRHLTHGTCSHGLASVLGAGENSHTGESSGNARFVGALRAPDVPRRVEWPSARIVRAVATALRGLDSASSCSALSWMHTRAACSSGIARDRIIPEITAHASRAQWAGSSRESVLVCGACFIIGANVSVAGIFSGPGKTADSQFGHP